MLVWFERYGITFLAIPSKISHQTLTSLTDLHRLRFLINLMLLSIMKIIMDLKYRDTFMLHNRVNMFFTWQQTAAVNCG